MSGLRIIRPMIDFGKPGKSGVGLSIQVVLSRQCYMPLIPRMVIIPIWRSGGKGLPIAISLGYTLFVSSC
ncbi:hypothetical protein D3C81_1488750 [compost metagenome]